MRKVIRFILVGALFGYFLISGQNLQIPKAQAQEVHLTQCGTLSQPNTTYILDNDVSSAGTCFTFTASNIILNLNGHTVTYNTSAGDEVFGVYSQYYSNIRITNSTPASGGFVQGGGNGYLCAGVHLYQVSAVEVDNLTFHYQGDDNAGIRLTGASWSSGANIHDNVVYPNGTKAPDPSYGYPRHYGIFGAIEVNQTGGIVSIKNNTIQGKGFVGINWTYAPQTPPTATVEIMNNNISIASPVRDGYGIQVMSPNNDDIGFEIAYNTITSTSGRGILVGGFDSSNDPGAGLGTVHDNFIDVREPMDSGEYSNPGTGVGIQLRFGAHDIQVYNNTVKSHGGQNACPIQFPTQQGPACTAVGIKVVGGLYAKNNRVYNNVVTVDTTGGSFNWNECWAEGLYGDGDADANTIFRNNTVTSNSILVDVNGDDGSGSNFNFVSNTFIKGANPQNFHSIRVIYWGDALNNVFLDNSWLNGATKDDLTDLNGSGNFSWSYYIKWYLNVTVKDGLGNQVSGATVNANATGGGSETLTATTDAAGHVRLILTEHYRAGTTSSSPSYTNYTPHTVTILKTGYQTETKILNMDTSKEMTVILDGTDNEPPIISNVMASNITQNSATISWQTDREADSKVEYGLDTNYGSTLTDTNLTTTHSLNLTNLSPNTYHFRVNSKDSSGKENIGIDHTFFILSITPQNVILTKSVDKQSAQSGEILTYTITYTISTQPITNAILEDPIPNGTTYITGSATGGGTFDGSKIILNIGNLAPGANGSVQFQVRVE